MELFQTGGKTTVGFCLTFCLYFAVKRQKTKENAYFTTKMCTSHRNNDFDQDLPGFFRNKKESIC